MTRQKRDRNTFQLTDDERIRRFAERRVDRYLAHIFQLRHLVQTTAADNSNIYFFHRKTSDNNRLDYRKNCRRGNLRPKAGSRSTSRGSHPTDWGTVMKSAFESAGLKPTR